MKTKLKPAQYRFYLLPILVVILILAATMVFLKPKIQMALAAHRRLREGKQNLTQLTTKLSTLEGLDQPELAKKTDLVLQAVPVEKDVPALLVVLEVLGEQMGVTILKVDTSPGELSTQSAQTKKTGVKQINDELMFDISISGDLEKIADFLQRVKKGLPLMKLGDVALVQQDQDFFQADLELQTFFLALPEKLTPVDASVAQVSQAEEAAYQQLLTLELIATESTLMPVQTGKQNPFAF